MMYYLIASTLLSIWICNHVGLTVKYNWEIFLITIILGWFTQPIIFLFILILYTYETASKIKIPFGSR